MRASKSVDEAAFKLLLEKEKSLRAEVEQDLNLRLRQQEAIAKLGEYALGSRSLDALFQEAAECVSTTLDMEYCKILQLLPDGKNLLLRAGVGWKDGLVGHATVGTDRDSHAGYTLLMDEPVIVDDLRTETRFSDRDMLEKHHVISGMSVVIPGKDSPYGVLGTHTARRKIFHPEDTRFIKAIASILATAIQRFSAEDALRRSRDELAIILQGITEGVTVQDQQGKLVYANQAAAEIMGFETPEEVMSARLEDVQKRFSLQDEQGRPVTFDKLPGRLVMQGESRATAKVRFRVTATGEERWSIVDATPVLDNTGQALQAVNIFRDITDLVLSEQYQRFLAEVGDLLTSSLDYPLTLTHVARLAVNNLADWCSIYLIDESQDAFQLTIAHRDPTKQDLAERYQRQYPPDLNSDTGIARVLKTGETVYLPIISDNLLVSAAKDAEQLAFMRALEIRSLLMVPLIARGRILGAISLIWAESGRHYSFRDVELSHELARRAALGIENARLYQQAQMTAAELEKRVTMRTQELVESNWKLARQIEEREKAEEALQKSELMLRSLFESAPDATFLMDQEGRIVQVNQQAEAMFGYSRSELVGMPIDHLIPARFQQTQAEKPQAGMPVAGMPEAGMPRQYVHETMTRTMGAGLELFATHKNGSEFAVDIMLSPVHMEKEDMLICAVRNITEQKRLQAELAETHRRLFESIEAERLRISQDLHDGPIQDLYGVALYLESFRELIEEAKQANEFQSTMNSIQTIVQSLRGICSELRPPILEQFGLEKAIRSHLGKLREANPEIKIEAHLTNDGLILSERTRLALYRVYQTAISNTIRHAGASHVWVRFEIQKGEIRLEIKDNGRGFNLPKKWINLAREGHFGLVGIAERVEALGGKLTIVSSPGQGATIQVMVPMNQSVLSAPPSTDIQVTSSPNLLSKLPGSPLQSF